MDIEVLQMASSNQDIKRIIWPDGSYTTVGVIKYGGAPLQAIIPYEEPAGLGPTTWFALVAGGRVVQRVNASYIDTVVHTIDEGDLDAKV